MKLVESMPNSINNVLKAKGHWEKILINLIKIPEIVHFDTFFSKLTLCKKIN